MTTPSIAGQLNTAERQLLTDAILNAPRKPEVLIEVGTWLGGGSTLHILRALHRNGVGHLWGVEAARSTYDRMLANIRSAAPEACDRFTPIFGFSQDVIPRWIDERGEHLQVDFVFLDGGNNPREQIDEFRLLDRFVPVGGQLMAHDAKLRKGKWLVPYLRALDHWDTQLHDVSTEGLFAAVKVADSPSAASLSNARGLLRKLQLNPAEIAASYLPSSVCGFFLKLLPQGVSRRLSDGR